MPFPPTLTRVIVSVSGNWMGAAYDGTRLIVGEEVNEHVVAALLSDLPTWTAYDKGFFSFWGMAAANDVWIGVGPEDVARYTLNAGASWSSGNMPTPTGRNWFSVATDGAGNWVAVTDSGTNRGARSTNNGASWSAVALASAVEWIGVVWDGSFFVAFGAGPAGHAVYSRSTNGASWTAAATVSADLESVMYGAANGGRIVLVGYKTGTFAPMSCTSTNSGTAWTAVDMPNVNFNTPDVVAGCDDGFIAVGSNTHGAWSTDALSWTEFSIPPGQFGTPMFLGGAGGQNGIVFGNYSTADVYVYGIAPGAVEADDTFFHFTF